MQNCAPGIDLHVASIMRSKYGQHPEYHTSLDDLSIVSPEGFQGSFNIHKECIELLENNETYLATQFCEPQLGRRGLRSNFSTLSSMTPAFLPTSNILVYADGELDLLALPETIGVSALDLLPPIRPLLEQNLLTKK